MVSSIGINPFYKFITSIERMPHGLDRLHTGGKRVVLESMKPIDGRYEARAERG